LKEYSLAYAETKPSAKKQQPTNLRIYSTACLAIVQKNNNQLLNVQ